MIGRSICSATVLCLAAMSLAQHREPAPETGKASGYVFHDVNKNGVRERGEPGLAGIKVSNQRQITQTDRNGRWELPTNDDTIFFVIKPRNWMTRVDKHNVPRFYYVHKPQGSPKLRFEGVRPTGPLPSSIDFALTPQKEPNDFTAFFFGDTQPRDLREVDYLMREVFEPLIGNKEQAFGVTLGDVVFDDLSVTDPLVQAIGLIGLPWYYVLGNHDINYDAEDDSQSDEFWERMFGPNYYSFDHGPTHFVVLDNVVWTSAKNANAERGNYKAGLGKTQMDWLRRDLQLVPKNQLVVFMMHIPMDEIAEKEELFRIIEQRPYALSVAAHTHTQEHRFFTAKDGWRGAKPHHHVVNVTTCGSWWSGSPNPLGVPHTTMRDGAPNGYSIFRFKGNQYSIEYRAANRPASYQMNVIAPETLKTADVGSTTIYANVFGGSAQSKVEYKFGDGPWTPMTQSLEPDPAYMALVERDKAVAKPFRPLPGAEPSPHLWKATLSATRQTGVVPLHVRTTDMFGQVYVSTRGIRVN